MKLKMLETVQGQDISGELDGEGITLSVLTPGDVFIVNENLGAWLLKHRKAEKVEAPKVYGAQPEPEARHDDEIEPEMLPIPDNIPAELPAKRGKGRK